MSTMQIRLLETRRLYRPWVLWIRNERRSGFDRRQRVAPCHP